MKYLNKKLLTILLVLMGMQLVGQNRALINLEEMQYNIGDTIDIPVQFMTAGLPIATFTIQIDFDETVIKPISSIGGPQWSLAKNLQASYARIAGMNLNGQVTDFVGAILKFEVIGLPGQLTYLDITLEELTNSAGVKLPFEYSNGQVAIYCEDDIFIGSPDIETIDNGVFRANETLNSNVTIDESDNTIEFRAGQEVTLQADFEIKQGSVFEILIKDCQDLSASQLINSNKETTEAIDKESNKPNISKARSNVNRPDKNIQLGVPIKMKN